MKKINLWPGLVCGVVFSIPSIILLTTIHSVFKVAFLPLIITFGVSIFIGSIGGWIITIWLKP